MEIQEAIQKYSPLLKKNLLPIALGLFGLMFFIYGLMQFFGQQSSSNDIEFSQSSLASENDTQPVKKITVDVEGAVIKPGVYHLSVDARIQDALVAAGGMSASADRNWTAKNLNLAAKLVDGAKVYVPSMTEDRGQKVEDRNVGLGSENSNEAFSSGLININTASEKELDTLAGVGEKTAQKIIDNRPYSSVEELLSKKVVNKSVFEKIKEKVTVY